MLSMAKKIVKLAVIKKCGECPFGLSIPKACAKVGKSIQQMAHLDILPDIGPEEKDEIAKANQHIYDWKADGTPCPFAGKLLPDKAAVECNWDSTAPGEAVGGSLVGSPFYYKHFSGIGLDGLYSYPLGYYTDNSIDRGMYQGMYSIESIAQIKSETTNNSEYIRKSVFSKRTNK